MFANAQSLLAHKDEILMTRRSPVVMAVAESRLIVI